MAGWRTFVTLMAGAFLGVLLSPISLWLLLYGDHFSPLQLQQPLLMCARSAPLTQSLRPQANGSEMPSLSLLHANRKLVSTRKLVYVAVLASPDSVLTTAAPIYRTWGKELGPHFGVYVFPERQIQEESVIVNGVPIKLVRNNSDTPRHLQKLALLEYLMENTPTPLSEYEFLLLVRDDVFVHVANLRNLLSSISPNNVLYAGQVVADNSGHCAGGPGILLSQVSVAGLRKSIGTCLSAMSTRLFPDQLSEDEALGMCMHSSLGVQCVAVDKEGANFFYNDHKGILASVKLQQTTDVIEKAVTVYPVRQPTLLYQLYQYVMELNFMKQMDQAGAMVSSAERVTEHLHHNTSRYGKQWWLWYKAHTNSKSRYELNTWQYFNSSYLFLLHEHQPIVNLPLRVKTAVNTALEVVLKKAVASESRIDPVMPPYNLVDGFLIMDEAWGIEYLLCMSVTRPSSLKPVNYIANVFLPFQGPGMSMFRPVLNKPTQTVVNLIVPVPRHHSLLSFLESFETECLKDNEAVNLHLVFFHHDEPMAVKIKQIQHIYPDAHIKCHEITGHNYSPSYAYSYVASTLSENELMVFFDVSFYFTLEFFKHCRMNTVQGKQAFSPVLFAFYKPDLVNKYIQKPRQTLITSDSGFFLRYNYQVLALYKSDYTAVKGFSKLKGTGSDDIKFVDRLLQSDIYLMRALEPYLWKAYRARTCKGLRAAAKMSCMNSMADSIGSKKVLGSLVASQNLI